MNTESDFTLISKYKEGQIKSAHVLYMRYYGLIKKFYIRLQKKFFNKLPIEVEDFMNEAYISLVDSLSYVDLTRKEIQGNKENWKMINILLYYLQMQGERIYKHYLKDAHHTTPLYVESGEGEEVCIPDLFVSTSKYESQEKQLEDKEVINNFYNLLTEFEKKVLDHRLEVKEKGKPKTLTNIAKELQTNYINIQKTCKSIENKFRRITL